ncbi:AT-rich interactive domain-containing protein 3 [Striga hermonthica]|uniref:AT-rich interactive domain-containing protein 3 n=1 Tax=Striga hermonthica TaxID=68872 RepID=A0A9N7N6I4_STRHE|nr:AT-rich interactive domain-containing protein 3 [Striga hermonthica]
MEDNEEAVQDALGGSGGTAAEEEQAQKVENKNSMDMQLESQTERNYEEKSPLLYAIENPEMLGDGQVFQVRENLESVQAEDENGETELNTENGLLEDDFENDSTSKGNIQEGVKGKVKEMKAVANNGNEVVTDTEVHPDDEMEVLKNEPAVKTPSKSFLLDANDVSGDESGTEEEQAAFMKELETFHRERCLDFKPPKFYQEPLNCLKLWRAVIRLGGYEQVTSLKLWRQVGESFRPPKTCTTVSWTFRGFYEKALLEYEKYKMRSGELPFTDSSLADPASGNQVDLSNPLGSGRARRDAAARAMQGWHSQRLLGNGEVGDPIIKDKNPITTPKREKQLRNIGFLKRKGSSPVEHAVKVAHVAPKSQSEVMVMDVGVPADWVKVNVQRMKDCYEVYALVPGLLREEVRVQSDPAGRLVISGQPEQQDNPWGVTPFKKVVSLPTRIDPHHTSAVVTLHGQLFVRVPFEQVDN